MSEHTATITWNRRGAPFVDRRYSRAHSWRFDGGAEVPASSSPAVVRVPMSDPAAVDPEEAFIAALSSCHMLCFLSAAADRWLVVDAYEDHPVGQVVPTGDGRHALGRIVLRPRATFGAETACSDEVLAELHAEAHHQCFLAAALKAELVVEPSRGSEG